MSKRSMREKKDNTREEEIIQAAAKLFSLKGYEATTLQDLADEVGILPGSLYYYIVSKEELLTKVVEPSSIASTKNIEEIAKSSLSSREKIQKALKDLLDLYVSNYPNFFVFLGEKFANLSEENMVNMKARQRNYKELWVKMIEEGIASGEIRADVDPRAVYFGVLGMCSWMHRWYSNDGRLTIAEICETFSKMILEGLIKKA